MIDNPENDQLLHWCHFSVYFPGVIEIDNWSFFSTVLFMKQIPAEWKMGSDAVLKGG